MSSQEQYILKLGDKQYSYNPYTTQIDRKNKKVYIYKYDIISEEDKGGLVILNLSKRVCEKGSIEGGDNSNKITVKQFYEQYLATQPEQYREGLKKILTYNPQIDYMLFKKYAKDPNNSFVKMYEEYKDQLQFDETTTQLNILCNTTLSPAQDFNQMSQEERQTCIMYFSVKPEEFKVERNKALSGPSKTQYKGGCNCGQVKVSDSFINDYLGGNTGFTIVQEEIQEEPINQERLVEYAKRKRMYCGGTTDIITLENGFGDETETQISIEGGTKHRDAQPHTEEIQVEELKDTEISTTSSSSFSSSTSSTTSSLTEEDDNNQQDTLSGRVFEFELLE